MSARIDNARVRPWFVFALWVLAFAAAPAAASTPPTIQAVDGLLLATAPGEVLTDMTDPPMFSQLSWAAARRQREGEIKTREAPNSSRRRCISGNRSSIDSPRGSGRSLSQ